MKKINSTTDKPSSFQHGLLAVLVLLGIVDAFFPSGRSSYLYLAIAIALIIVIPYILKLFDAKLSNLTWIALWLFIVVACYLSNRFTLYKRFWFHDVIMHFSSGFVLALLWHDFLFRGRKWESAVPLPVRIFIAILASVASAGLWEIGEFFADIITKMDFQRNNLPEYELIHSSWQNSGIMDTMNDMINGTVGALLSIIPLSRPEWKKHAKTA